MGKAVIIYFFVMILVTPFVYGQQEDALLDRFDHPDVVELNYCETVEDCIIGCGCRKCDYYISKAAQQRLVEINGAVLSEGQYSCYTFERVARPAPVCVNKECAAGKVPNEVMSL